MKKLLVLVIALATVSVASAQKRDNERQERHQKDYSSYLPKKGDIAMGVDLVGIVKFAGNSIAGTADRYDVAPFKGDIFAKYFLTDNIALRGRLGLDVANTATKHFVQDDVAVAADPESDKRVTDITKINGNSFQLGLGIEFRRGIRRVQGYAGAELFIGRTHRKTSYEYGNQITEDNQHPTSIYGGYNSRLLEQSSNAINGGLAIFAGVDYFIARNVSLGFEFGLTGSGTSSPISATDITEEWDTANNVYKKTTEKYFPKQSSFGITPSAGANLMFYF
jgi:hypothetical protein